MLLKLLSIPILLVAIVVGYLYQHSPWLFGQKLPSRGPKQEEKYKVLTNIADLDDELFPLSKTLGPNFGPYRNHCQRVLTFTYYFLPDEEFEKQPKVMELAAIALAYHDIGLWVDGGQLDYLEPSADKLWKDLHDNKGFTPHELDLMKEIILQHHRLTEYPSNNKWTSTENAIIESVRKADLADFTLGVFRHDLPPQLVQQTLEQIPNLGFHQMLMGMPSKLSPGNLKGQLDILKIFKW